MDSIRSNMIKQSDIGARLRLFRYGLVVITVVTFVLGLVYPWVALRGVEGLADSELPSITSYLPFALLATVVVAVAMVVIYFVYAEVLKRTVGKDAASES
jgi:riboflavin transporter FmnP